MTETPNIFLVGPMGAGKSSIGRQLAKRLRREFLDTDKELEHRTGVDIPTIFEFEGENGFRARESAILDELTAVPEIVLATGGGAVLSDANRRWLTARGTVVYLRADIETLLRRTAKDRNRPLLQTDNRRERLESLMQQREPLYHEVSDLVVSTEDARIPTIVQRILSGLQLDSPANGS